MLAFSVVFQDFSMSSVSGSLDEMSLEGGITVYNGGFLEIDIKKVTYTVVIKDLGTEATGFIEGKSIAPGMTEDFRK